MFSQPRTSSVDALQAHTKFIAPAVVRGAINQDAEALPYMLLKPNQKIPQAEFDQLNQDTATNILFYFPLAEAGYRYFGRNAVSPIFKKEIFGRHIYAMPNGLSPGTVALGTRAEYAGFLDDVLLSDEISYHDTRRGNLSATDRLLLSSIPTSPKEILAEGVNSWGSILLGAELGGMANYPIIGAFLGFAAARTALTWANGRHQQASLEGHTFEELIKQGGVGALYHPTPYSIGVVKKLEDSFVPQRLGQKNRPISDSPIY